MSVQRAAREEREASADPLPRVRRATWRTLLVGVAAALVVIGGAVVAQRLAADDAPLVAYSAPGSPAPQPGELAAVSGAEDRPLPAAVLEGFDGAAPVDLERYRGAPLVVNFWATWCPPCVEEMPDFERVADDLAGRVAFLGVNALDRAPAAAAFVEEVGVSYDLAVDAQGSYFEEVGGFGWPTTLLVDEDGRIRYRRTGPLDEALLRTLLEEHLDVAAGA